MNSAPLLFLGIFATLASSFWGLVLVPQLQLGGQEQVINSQNFTLYPATRGGSAKQGAEVYRSLGCVECHSQQVRGLGHDREQGWGVRNTVAQDYLGDYPVLLGSQRIGPDLANVGLRQTNANNLLQHLYSPQVGAPGSMMPPYRFLFERGKPASEVVPGPEANALVDYLMSLRADAPLYEAPVPKSGTNATDTASTNAPGTNVLSANAAAATNVVPSAVPAGPPK